MGSGSTEVALVRFSTYGGGKSGKGATPQFEVLDVEWDATLGANTLDALLVDYFAKEFNVKHPKLADVR